MRTCDLMVTFNRWVEVLYSYEQAITRKIKVK